MDGERKCHSSALLWRSTRSSAPAASSSTVRAGWSAGSRLGSKDTKALSVDGLAAQNRQERFLPGTEEEYSVQVTGRCGKSYVEPTFPMLPVAWPLTSDFRPYLGSDWTREAPMSLRTSGPPRFLQAETTVFL